MNLQPDDKSPGHYVNRDWTSGTAGTFAVILGVSRYDYLDGSATSYGLDQLHVSALTAWRFFEWLRDEYAVANAPLAECWLLLAPVAEELQAEPALASQGAPATMDNAAQAIGYWHQAMDELPQPATPDSRAVFFFSGHGLEIHQDNQILLPTDYLRPPAKNVNDALSTSLLMKGLGTLAVPNQFFFLDACRSDARELRQLDIEGRRILNIAASALTNPDRVAPLFYATSSGTQAWQPRTPGEGISIFGRALIEGLCGHPPLEHVLAGPQQFVNVFPLQKYLKQRVAQLLKEFGSKVGQPVRLGGSIDDVAITELPLTPDGVTRGAVLGQDTLELPPDLAETLEGEFTERSDVPWQPDFGIAHTLFGSESVSAIWLQGRAFALGAGVWSPPGEGFEIEGVERDETSRVFRIQLRLPTDPIGHWFQLDDGESSWACILPAEELSQPLYELELDVEHSDPSHDGRWIGRLAATLSTANSEPPLRLAAELWRRYWTMTAGEAAVRAEKELMHLSSMRAASPSPLFLVVATTILLRAGRREFVHRDVLEELWSTHRHPDAAVLLAELVRRQGGNSPGAQATRQEYLLGLEGLPVPHLGQVAGYAVGQLEELLELSKQADPDRPRLEALMDRLRKVMRFYRNEGLFSVYSGSQGALDPALIFPEDNPPLFRDAMPEPGAVPIENPPEALGT